MAYKLLIVEDDETTQILYKNRVASSKHPVNVTFALSYEEAKKALRANKFDAIITDHLLGKKTGFDIIELVDKNLPVIFITGVRDVKVAVNAMKLGAHDYIVKDKSGNYIDVLPIIIEKAISQKQAKLKYEEIEKQYKDLFENSNDLIQFVNPDGKFEYVNPSWLRTLEYTEEELKELSFIDIIDENYKEHCLAVFKELKSGKSFFGVEIKFVSKSGNIIYVEGNISADLRQDKMVVTRGIFRNVTEKKIAENELKRSEAKYRQLIEHATDIIYETDADGNFTFINEVTYRLLGYSIEEIMGQHFTILLPQNYKEEIHTFYKNQLETKQENSYLEVPILKKDGSVMWLGQNVRVLCDQETENIIGFAAIARDITERKSYERELKKLSLVASKTDNYVIICDHNDRIEWVNQTFTDITGFTFEEVEGKKPENLLRGPKTDIKKANYMSEMVKKNKVSSSCELLNYTKDKKEIWLYVSVTPILDEKGAISQFISVGNDISDKKLAETKIKDQNKKLEGQNIQIEKTKKELLKVNKELLRVNNHLEELVDQRTLKLQITNEKLLAANKELDLYVYRASHDLRGPMATLLGLSKIAQKESAEPVALNYFDRIEKSTLSLENILRKLLSISRIRKHKRTVKFHKVDDIVSQIKKSYKNFIDKNEVTVEFKYDKKSEIYTDEYLLINILQNLLENSVYFRREERGSKPLIKVSFNVTNGHQSILVSDNGIGIDQIYIDKIFDMFFRISEKSTGNGLGLYITKLAIEKLKGSMKVESEPNNYTLVKIKLPKKKLRK